MPRQSKPFEYPLSDEIAQAVLNLPVTLPVAPPPTTVRECLEQAIEAVAEANRLLETNPMAKIVAQSLMRQIKRRGDARIMVRPDGVVVLRISYGTAAEQGGRSRRDAPGVRAAHRTSLPYLDDLRRMAADAGIDVSHLGQRRRAIFEYIATHQSNVKPGFDEVKVSPVEQLRPSRGPEPVVDSVMTLLGMEPESR